MKPHGFFSIKPLSLRGFATPSSVLLAVILGVGRLLAEQPALTGDRVPTKEGDLVIHPVNHATLAFGWKNIIVYADPVGGAQRFAGLPGPNLIVVTDIHGDHLNGGTLKAVAGEKTSIIVPAAVASDAGMPEELRSRLIILNNGESKEIQGVGVEAVPMYNLTPARAKFHTKGRGNGYVLTFGDKRVYLSGDTEDIPEMRALKNIDVAFVCMNLPYTMTVDQAAGAVREFRPKIVYPYHYRGSDLDKFKELVGDGSGVEVRVRDWYK